MSRVRATVLSSALALAAFASASLPLPARADDAGLFMQRFSGSWIGSGKLLFGAEPRPEFACELKGDPGESQLTFGLSGQCRMGMMSAPVFAQLHYDAKTKRFYGQFMDGAAGNGVDIVGARAGEGFSLKLTRGEVQGRLAAQAISPAEMRVTLFLHEAHGDAETPVAVMGLTRREIITGSIAPTN